MHAEEDADQSYETGPWRRTTLLARSERRRRTTPYGRSAVVAPENEYVVGTDATVAIEVPRAIDGPEYDQAQ